MPRGASGRFDTFVGFTTTPDWIDAVAEEQAPSSSTSSMAWIPTAKSSVRGTALKPLAQLPRFGVVGTFAAALISLRRRSMTMRAVLFGPLTVLRCLASCFLSWRSMD